MTEHEKNLIQESKNEGLKKAVGAKVGEREAKKDATAATRLALSKKNGELEK